MSFDDDLDARVADRHEIKTLKPVDLPIKRGRGRPRKNALPPEPPPVVEKLDWTETVAPVTVGFLAKIFRKKPETISKRLAGVRPKQVKSDGSKLYDFVDAASYIVDPKIDLAAYIKSLRAQDMPPHLQDAFWAGMRKRQIWEQHAGDLWRTDKVREVLGETFKTMNATITLWADTIEQEHVLTDEQRQAIVRLGDSLRRDLHQSLVTQAGQGTTYSSLSEVDGIAEGDPESYGDRGDPA